MKGTSMLFNIATSILIAAVIASNIDQALGLTVSETCQVVKNGTFIADPESCQGWAFCSNGQPIYGKCNDGYLYDSPSGTCNYAEKVNCNTNVTTMCTGQTNIFKGDPYNCQNYCYCLNGVSYCESCPENQYFNQTTSTCVYASECNINSPCVLAQNGFVGDIASCDGWFRCLDGHVAKSGICDSGYYYDALKEECNYVADVACSLAPPTLSPAGPPIPDDVCATAAAGDFVADESTCRGYFLCSTVGDDSPKWGQCPKGSDFDSTDQECINTYDVACTFDRCYGVTKGFMAVAGTDCNTYYICEDGVSVGQGECPTGYTYFNEIDQVCQEELFNFPICTVTV